MVRPDSQYAALELEMAGLQAFLQLTRLASAIRTLAISIKEFSSCTIA